MTAIYIWILIYITCAFLPVLLFYPWGDGFPGDVQLMALFSLPVIVVALAVLIQVGFVGYNLYTDRLTAPATIYNILLILLVVGLLLVPNYVYTKKHDLTWTASVYENSTRTAYGIVDIVDSTKAVFTNPKKNTMQDSTGMQTGPDGLPIIFWTIKKEDRDEIIELLEAGTDIESKGYHKATPVLAAAVIDDWITVELLIDRGAKIDVNDERGYTVPFLAYRSKVQLEGSYGQALVRVRQKIEEAGIAHWQNFSPQEVKERLASDAWPPISTDELEQYQKEADVVRVQALAHWAELIEEYHQKTGSYPLIDDIDLEANAQMYVFIARDQQWQAIADQQSYLPENAFTIFPGELIYALERGLNRVNIEERYDPQSVSSGAPNFMIYMTQNDTYYLAAHFLNAYSFTAPVNNAYQKVEVTNAPEAPYQITYADLQNDADFKRLRSETITSKWFKELIDKNKDRFKEEPYHAEMMPNLQFTYIRDGKLIPQRTNTQAPATTEATVGPKARLDEYVATNYPGVSLNLTKLKETDSSHVYQANLDDPSSTFFIYFVVPVDSTQPIMPVGDISGFSQTQVE